GGQSECGFAANAHDLFQRQTTLAVESLIERFSLEKLHGHERYAAVLADLIDADNVIVLKGGGGLRFAQEALPRSFAGGELRQHCLQCHFTLEQWVLGEKD